MKCLLGVMTWAAMCFMLVAQENYTRFERIYSKEGFTQGVVTSIWQDSRGFMWFGTQGGLFRYNGYEFTEFSYNPKDTSSLSVNRVLVIYENRQDELWIGTDGGGLNRFNRKTENFTRYVYQNDLDPNPDPGVSSVKAILEDAHGILWVGTYGGLLRYEREKNKWHRFSHRVDDPLSLSNNQVSTLCEDKQGQLWIGTRGGGVNVMEPGQETFLRYSSLPDSRGGLSNDNVNKIVADDAGQLWIGTESGLDRFDCVHRKFFNYQNQPAVLDSLSDNWVRTLYIDKEKVLWVATRNGLNRLKSLPQGTFIHYRNQFDKPTSLSQNDVFAIFEGNEGSIWIGTNGGGINRLDRQKQQSGHYLGNPNDGNSLSSNDISSFLQDWNGVLWVGTNDRGLHRYDARAGKFIHYNWRKTDPTSLSSDEVVAIHQDKQGDMWVGTWGGGVNRLKQGSTKFERFIHKKNNSEKDASGPGSNEIFCFAEDWDGNLWIGTWGGGLNRLDRVKKVFVTYKNNPTMPGSISSNSVTVICPDVKQKAVLWVGTYYTGLDRFERDTGIFEHYTHIADNTACLSHNSVRAIYSSPGQPEVLWIGTAGGGLNRFDHSMNNWRVYTKADGLSDNTILGILEDGKGWLWMSTNKGLTRFNPKNGQSILYDVNTGLQGNEFNQGAFYKGRDGRFYFGGLNGYNAFFPEKISRNPFLPPVVITSFKIFNSAAPLSQSIVETKEIHLSYRDSVFSFEFAALNYIGTEKNKYAYKIKDGEDQWIQLNNKREITFSSLSPGTYNFQVKGSNNDGVWNDTGASIKLFIHPPFWQTWWFRFAVILGILAGIFVLYSWRVRKYKRLQNKLEMEVTRRTCQIVEQSKIIEDKHKQLELAHQELKKSEENLLELNATKDKFFSIISHDLRNHMTAIIGPTSLLANSYEKLPETVKTKYTKMMEKSVNQLYELLENLLQWARSQTGGLNCKPREIYVDDIIYKTVAIHNLNAKKKSIQVLADLPDNVTAYADRDMVTFIFRNLVSNAVKFTEPGGVVRLTAVVNGDSIEASVIDNGVGVSEKNAKVLFKVGMIRSTPGTSHEKGNGLGLILCKEFVEKNGGRIWYEKPHGGDGKGSIFRFTLPKYKSKR